MINHIYAYQITISWDMIFSTLFGRKDDRVTIDRQNDGGPVISNRSIEIRRRKRQIIHIIHYSTTVIEYLGLGMWLVCQFLLFGWINSYVTSGVALTINLACAMILVPFSHLFNEHRIKVMVLEHGWIFAMKNAIRFNIDSRIAPIPNHCIRNQEGKSLGSNNNDGRSIGKSRNQESIQSIVRSSVPPKKNDVSTKLDKGSYGQKIEDVLPNQVLAV